MTVGKGKGMVSMYHDARSRSGVIIRSVLLSWWKETENGRVWYEKWLVVYQRGVPLVWGYPTFWGSRIRAEYHL